MRALIQRVSRADVTIDGVVTGSVDRGFLVLLGVGQGDGEAEADRLLAKLLKLRLFADERGKTNLNIDDVEGKLLVISQFTLYADCRKGNRPSFADACEPHRAKELYEYFVSRARGALGTDRVQTGEFAADMAVSLVNDGPFTVWLDTAEL